MSILVPPAKGIEVLQEYYEGAPTSKPGDDLNMSLSYQMSLGGTEQSRKRAIGHSAQNRKNF